MDLASATKFFPPKTGDKISPQIWADLGCGDGLFSRALAEFLAPGSAIYAVDRSANFSQQMPEGIHTQEIRADFTGEISALHELDGLIMANALHFVKDQEKALRQNFERLKRGGTLILIEYDTDVPNRWVPYPLSRNRLSALIEKVGFESVQEIHRQPSAFGRAELYSLSAQKTCKVLTTLQVCELLL